jgi:hypothetical protein
MFWYAPITKDSHIRQPLGFSDGTRKVCHLKCCLYGLKQSPREFNMLLRDGLVTTGWQECVFDPCFYIFRTASVFAMTALHVDGIPAACNDTAWLTSFKARLGARFKIKDLGALSQLLGMPITRDMSARTISLDWSKYLQDILDKHGMTYCKPLPLPMEPGFVSGLARLDLPLLTCVAKDIFPSLLGNLQYAAVYARPDVSTTLSSLSYVEVNPTEVHLQALKKVVRYLKGTIQLSLMLEWGGDHNLQLTCFADVAWAYDNSARKSRSGYLLTFGRGHVGYKSKQQTYVAQSTCKAEYYYVGDTTKERLHLRQHMGEIFNAPITDNAIIWEDNRSAIAYSQNTLVSEKTKHIGMK